MKHTCRHCGEEVERSEAWERAFYARTTLVHADFCDKPACRKVMGLKTVKRGLSWHAKPYDGPWGDEPGEKEKNGLREVRMGAA